MNKQEKYNNIFMSIAETIAQLSLCERRKVGAVIVKDYRIIATGFNGNPKTVDNCCEENNTTLPTVIHAEINAILNSVAFNLLPNSTLYVTTSPCLHCASMIIQSGITTVYYRDIYYREGHKDSIKYLEKHFVNCFKI